MTMWADAFPVVTVPKAATPKHVTLVLPFYENHGFLERQIEHWWRWEASVCELWSAIIVDDGSPRPATLPKELPFRTSLYRIEEDVPWNWIAARNIGAHHAADGWVLFTDIDHVIPNETASALARGEHDPTVIYALSRREHTGQAIWPHSASFFMTRKMFWRVGGYDEALSGHYGTDGDWRRRCMKAAQIQILKQALIRYEHIGDSSTKRYERKLPADAEAVRRIVRARERGWKPKTLSFKYHQVSAC